MARAAPRGLWRPRSIFHILMGIIMFISFLYFFVFSSTTDEPSLPTRQVIAAKEAASHYLSPASLPFKRSRSKSTGESDGPPPVVHYKMNNLTTSSDPIGNNEAVLILTPMAKFYQGYWDNLLSLNYPHELISLGFILPKGRDGNAATSALQAQILKTQSGAQKQRFASVTILRQDTETPLTTQLESERHKLDAQKSRRAAMAKARNSLLFTTLGPTTSWVLWLDADIIETPASLIQDLAKHDKPIITPNCFQRFTDPETGKPATRPYDYNNWVDSPTAQDLAKNMGKDDILLEGYAEMATYRTLLAKMPELEGSSPEAPSDANVEIELDGVGGTALLVKADVHRDGAMFPPFAFYHLIETEGFAKMARRLGWKSWGLPNYYIYHYNE